MLKISSFNCHSLKNSLTEVHSICSSNDIVFLQETWLAKFELNNLNAIHQDFLGNGTSAFDSYNSILSGRPFGGVAILWKKCLQARIKVITLSERMMKVDISTNIGTVSLINVYLPTDYKDSESHDQFCMCLGQLASILDDTAAETSYFGIIGDCNANSNGSTFFTELSEFSSENGLIISDIDILGATSNTFTFVSAAHGTTSWLDHCLCSPNLHSLIQSMCVNYDISITDHMPLFLGLLLRPSTLVPQVPVEPKRPNPNWTSASLHNRLCYNRVVRF